MLLGHTLRKPWWQGYHVSTMCTTLRRHSMSLVSSAPQDNLTRGSVASPVSYRQAARDRMCHHLPTVHPVGRVI